jgi:peptidoglycan/LPS O-acetylase OafA/YrhL
VQRIPSLDGLRAISILMVVTGHLAGIGLAPASLKIYAGIGVRIFFVLSGYLITTILLKERDRTSSINLRQFYIRRAYRIFPAAFFYMLIVFGTNWHTLRWYEMAAALCYVVNCLPHHAWVVGHLWSLSVEEQFYLLWPGILKAWHKHRIAILACVFVLSPIYNAAIYYLKWIHTIGPVTLPSVADNLAVGCLVAVFATRWPKVSKPLFAMLVLLVIAIPRFDSNSAPKTLFAFFVLFPIMEIAIAGILIHVVQNPYRVLNLAPVVWLGQISYSLYLWQQPFLNPTGSMPRYGIIGGLAAAITSFYLIERPLLKYRDRRVPDPVDTRVEAVAA